MARIGLNRVNFDPNAFDADNDGRVQDSTPFERPAVRKPPSADFYSAEYILSRPPAPQKRGKPQKVDFTEEPDTFGDGQGGGESSWTDPVSKYRYVISVGDAGNEWSYTAYVRDGDGKKIFEENFRGRDSSSLKETARNFLIEKNNEIIGRADKDNSSSQPTRAQKIISGINKNASKEKFDASREYGDYESKFPKHEVDGTMRRDTADLPKMREMMKDLIKEAKTSGVMYSFFSKMSDDELQELWSALNAMKEPETRAQFLAMMLADFELGLRKLARDRAKTGPAPFEDKDKVKKIIDNLTGRGLI